jgi:hypothetical protein
VYSPALDTLGYKSPSGIRYKVAIRRTEMRKFFAILAFLAGGITTEMRNPLQCTTIPASAGKLKRPEK